jgi:hypothetical protein
MDYDSSSALERFKDNLPNRPYFSNSKKFNPEFIRDKDEAIQYPYIQINFPTIHYLVFDLDYLDAAWAMYSCDIPGPTLVAMNKENGHAHYYYELLYPLPRDYRKRSKTTKPLLKNVIEFYRDTLRADRVIYSQKLLVKNPLHSKWQAIDSKNGCAIYTLSELAESISSEWRPSKPNHGASSYQQNYTEARAFKETLDPLSRTMSLFNNIRYYAYSIVGTCSSEEGLFYLVLEWAEKVNKHEISRHFPHKGMLSFSEVRSVTRSVVSWTYEHRYTFREREKFNVGAMGFESMKGKQWTTGDYKMEVRHRQSMAAHRTNQHRRENTERQIRDAVTQCRQNGIAPNVSHIARMIGRPRKTVAYYRDIIASQDMPIVSEQVMRAS